MPEFVCLADYEDAASIVLGRMAITEGPQAPGPVGRLWLQSIAGHIADKVDRYYFRDVPKLSTEQQVKSALKGLGEELAVAATALELAAGVLRGAGKVMPAQATFLAGQRARKAAQQVGV